MPTVGDLPLALAETDAEFADWMRAHQQRAQALIGRFVPADHPVAPKLHEAMHYAAGQGGKRVRPMLVWAAGECVRADADSLDRAACAVELVHAYSLVHDDLPCMDDDVLRRGQPTTHVRFGEALALLAGDALQALAYEVLTPDVGVPPGLQARLCALLARASGADGMAGGQTLDILATGGQLDRAALMDMHTRKTGALLKASVLMGAACGGLGVGAQNEAQIQTLSALSDYADAIGLAFQVVDDMLDATADSLTLGKTAGKDAQQNKATYVTVLGLDAARALAHDLRDRAHAALDRLPAADCDRSQRLRDLADLIVIRTH